MMRSTTQRSTCRAWNFLRMSHYLIETRFQRSVHTGYVHQPMFATALEALALELMGGEL